MAEIRECRYCLAEIVFVQSATTGRWFPINPKPDESGNVVLEVARAADSGDTTGLTRAVVVQPDDPRRPRFMPHHATCPKKPKRSRTGGTRGRWAAGASR